jgi:N-acetylglucosaminyldiphosphoundecaprenol N-acetyl-beta-D-mannosaminyltransferase
MSQCSVLRRDGIVMGFANNTLDNAVIPDVPSRLSVENVCVSGRERSERARVRVLDIFLDIVGFEQVRDKVRHLSADERLRIVTANIQFIREARMNTLFAATVNSADIVVTDGKPLVWISRIIGAPIPQQVTGHDLFHDFTSQAAKEGLSVFLLGGGPGIASEAASRLRTNYPGLRVTGTDGGHFSSEGEAENPERLRQIINEFNPYFLFVALGCPKQDLWIARNFDVLNARVCVGVGGVLDVYTGRLSRAPRWMQRWGLESVYQLLVAPRRYARRYLFEYPPTAARILYIAVQRLYSALYRRATDTARGLL